jgi:hypothetical protein
VKKKKGKMNFPRLRISLEGTKDRYHDPQSITSLQLILEMSVTPYELLLFLLLFSQPSVRALEHKFYNNFL